MWTRVFKPWSVMNQHIRENEKLREELKRETLLVNTIRQRMRDLSAENEKLFRRLDNALVDKNRLEAQLRMYTQRVAPTTSKEN